MPTVNPDKTSWVSTRVELSGDLTREETEALLLELRQLAQRHGLTLRRVPTAKAESP